MKSKIRNAFILSFSGLLLLAYNNCGGGFVPLSEGMGSLASQNSGTNGGGIGGIGGGGSNTSTLTCNDAVLQELYKNSFHTFLRSKTCVGCHGGASAVAGQPPPIASADINVAYSAFKLKVGSYLNMALTNNASSSAHNGAGSVDFASQVQGYNTAWNDAVKVNCVSSSPGGVDPGAMMSTKQASMTLAANASMRYSFNLHEVSPLPSSPSLTGMTLSVQVQAASATTPQDGYFISAMRLTTSTDGLAIAGFKIAINGEVYEEGSTFSADHVDIPAGMSEYPVTIGTMFIPMTRAAGDKISISIQAIAAPTIRQNGAIPDPKAAAPTYSEIPRFSELIAPGCASCHNSVFKTAGLNILDPAKVMTYVGATSAASPLFRKLSANTTSNVMPPAPDRLTTAELNFVKAWIDGGAPN